MNTKKVIVSTVLGASLLFTSVPFNVFNTEQVKAETVMATTSFSDVSKNSFAYDAIQKLTKRKIILGYNDGTFKPGTIVTRGQFATFLARALDLPEADSNFKDLPKSKALYKDVSRAAAAGLIQGDTKGYVNADKPVTRADIAVMIDRAMNMKGNFTETTNLTFKDAGSVPKYAFESVKRMTKYGIIAGKNDNTFAPSEHADRATSSVFVYRMINLIENPTKPVPPAEDDWKKWSKERIEQEVGEFKVTVRTQDKVYVQDFVQYYWRDLQDPVYAAVRPEPKEYFADWVNKNKDSFLVSYSTYPTNEIIAFNGVPYRESELFLDKIENPTSQYMKDLNAVIPTPPKQEGQFLLDLHTEHKDSVTYTKGKAEVTTLKAMPEVLANNNEFMVDIKSAFSDAQSVTVSNNGLQLKHGNNILELTNNSDVAILNGSNIKLPSKVTTEDGVVKAPVLAVSKALGLHTRQMTPQYPYSLRVEIADYPLEKDGWYWID
ncbi:S-layer homology domain-containing protein [Bacillus sp. JJ722]|uniref:S-layer homology domain-containing protein n=1 Tax=Bacillus sp. JJ722 TaxID=3122973 RepID=UPI002FFEFCCB